MAIEAQFIKHEKGKVEKRTRTYINDGIRDELLEQFLDAKSKGLKYTGQKASERTIDSINTALKRVIRLSGKGLADITAEDFEQVISKAHDEGLSNSAINVTISTARNFYNWAMKSGRLDIKEAPTEGLMLRKVSQRPPLTITETEFNRLLKAIEDIDAEKVENALATPQGGNFPWVHDESRLQKKLLPIKLMYYGGFRVGEVVSLEKDAIKEKGVLVTGKGDKTRFVPLPKFLLDELREFADEFGGERYVFIPLINRHDSEQPIGTQTVDIVFRDAVKRAKLNPKLTPHKLRHTYATNVLQKTGRIDLVQDILGHSDPATTRIYARNNEQNLSDAIMSIWD